MTSPPPPWLILSLKVWCVESLMHTSALFAEKTWHRGARAARHGVDSLLLLVASCAAVSEVFGVLRCGWWAYSAACAATLLYYAARAGHFAWLPLLAVTFVVSPDVQRRRESVSRRGDAPTRRFREVRRATSSRRSVHRRARAGVRVPRQTRRARRRRGGEGGDVTSANGGPGTRAPGGKGRTEPTSIRRVRWDRGRSWDRGRGTRREEDSCTARGEGG